MLITLNCLYIEILDLDFFIELLFISYNSRKKAKAKENDGETQLGSQANSQPTTQPTSQSTQLGDLGDKESDDKEVRLKHEKLFPLLILHFSGLS